MRTWSLAIVAAAALLFAAPARGAQPDLESPDAPNSPIQKGRSELGWYLAAGSTLSPQAFIGYRPSVEIGVHWGRVVSEPRGPGFLEGNLEVGLDVVPVFLVLNGETVYGVHAAVAFTHYLYPTSRIRPFVSLRSGPLVTSSAVPMDTSKFNFASSLGLGVAIPATRRLLYTLEVTFQHVSNADTAPHNPGMNSVQAQFGMRLYR